MYRVQARFSGVQGTERTILVKLDFRLELHGDDKQYRICFGLRKRAGFQGAIDTRYRHVVS